MLDHLLTSKSIVQPGFQKTLEKLIEKERVFRLALRKLAKGRVRIISKWEKI